MTITNYTDLELRLQAELAELKAQLDQVLEQNTWLDKKLAKFSGLPMKYKRMEFNAQLQRENDELKAKLAEYEKQEPVATLHDDGYWTWIGTPPYESSFAGWRMNVYTKGTP